MIVGQISCLYDSTLPMEASISQVVYDAGQKIYVSPDYIADTLNQALNQLLPSPFCAAKGFTRDTEGQKTDIFNTIIYTSAQTQPALELSYYDADNVACVIDVCENLDIDKLRTAYKRIACAKKLKKTPSEKVSGFHRTTVTLGIIFSVDAILPLESLAEEIDHLNQQHPDRERTDMVVVLSKGIISYAVQFPGEKHISGDYLPPVEGATSSYSPPMYIIIVVRPTGRFTFNKMFSFIIAHLMTFAPDAKLPNWADILEGTPKEAMVIIGYQYNLSGKLMPVPRQFYSDKYIPPRPYRIEDQQGNLLSTLQFIPWQDGGVVLLSGKLPLDGLLIFLGKKAFERGGITRRDNLQISSVIPIIQSDFMQMMENIQQRSNMVVKLDNTNFVIQKIADEGSNSPFMARLYMGVLQLRDFIFREETRLTFDKPYHFVMETMINTRDTARQIIQLMDEHFSKLAKGEVGHLRGGTINIEKPIDKELRKEVETFLISSVRILKQGMQEVVQTFGKDIGFLFKKQSTFENGINILTKDDKYLAAYLLETRNWSDKLINYRNAIEHNGWLLPGIKYASSSGIIHADEPEISGQKLSDFVKFIMDRLTCFVEEVTVHCLEAKMPDMITVKEIPLAERRHEMPLRFQVALADSRIPIWTITYHKRSFEET